MGGSKRRSAAQAGGDLKRRRLTEFRRQVLAACKSVKRGSFTSYGEIAKALGRGSARSVGTALKGNPFAPIVPCHRVVRSDFTIGGFHGATDPASPEIARKISLLKAEGVRFGDDGRVVPDSYVTAAEMRAPTEAETEPEELARAE